MEYTLFQDDTEEILGRAREQLVVLDKQEKFDAGDQSKYQECLDFIQKNHSYLYQPEEQIAFLKKFSVDVEVLQFLGDFGRLYVLFSEAAISSLDGVFGIDRKTFATWEKGTRGKWLQWVEMREALLAKREQLERYYELETTQQVFPVLDKKKTYTLAEKIDAGVEQYLSALKEYEQYHARLSMVIGRMEEIFQIGQTAEALIESWQVTREALRQFKEKYLNQILAGGLEDIPQIKFDTSLVEEIRKYEAAGARYKSVDTLNSFLGCEDYMQTHVPLFLSQKKLFDVDVSGVYPYFDQPYFLPAEESVEVVKRYVSAIIKVMGANAGAEIRPMTLEQIQEKLTLFDASLEIDEQILTDLLLQHRWVEQWQEEEVTYYQLVYSRLFDYQKIARIVYEKKSVSYEDIQRIDREKSTDGKCMNGVNDNAIITRNMYEWVCLSGVEGSLTYEESGKGPQSLIVTVRDFVRDYKIFTFPEIMAYLKRENYPDFLNENSLKSYILRDCVSCIDDAQLFCLTSCLKDFPHHRWRNRNRNVRNRLVAYSVEVLKKTPKYALPASELNQLLKDFAVAEDLVLDMEDPVNYMFDRGCIRDLMDYDGKQVSLTKKAKKLDAKGVENLKENVQGVARPALFDDLAKKIWECLNEAENKEILLKDLKRICLPLTKGKSRTYIYTFINRQLPFKVEHIDRDGASYLKLAEEE